MTSISTTPAGPVKREMSVTVGRCKCDSNSPARPEDRESDFTWNGQHWVKISPKLADAYFSTHDHEHSAEQAKTPPLVRTPSTTDSDLCHCCHRRMPSSTENMKHVLHHQPIDQCNEDVCPDIHMPTQSPRPKHHGRRHSGLCHETDSAHIEPTEPARPQKHIRRASGLCEGGEQYRIHGKDCQCKDVRPIDNIWERYGFVEINKVNEVQQ